MTTPKAKDPKVCTIYGRLSFPVWTHAQAVERNAKSQYKKDDPAKVAPEFTLLVEQAQLDKLRDHILNVFLPFTVEQSEKGEKRNAFTQAEADRIANFIKAGDWDLAPPHTPFKNVHDKTAPLAPECVAAVKVNGQQGQNLTLKAQVNSEAELTVPEPDILSWPVVRPIGSTVHQMYPGCYVAASLNLYAYLSGKVPGITASASTAVFKADGTRFGGGVEVDEDEIFLD